MSHTEYSAQFVQYSSVFLGLEEALRTNVHPACQSPVLVCGSLTMANTYKFSSTIVDIPRKTPIEQVVTLNSGLKHGYAYRATLC
jgi:hypothetical protein